MTPPAPGATLTPVPDELPPGTVALRKDGPRDDARGDRPTGYWWDERTAERVHRPQIGRVVARWSFWWTLMDPGRDPPEVRNRL